MSRLIQMEQHMQQQREEHYCVQDDASTCSQNVSVFPLRCQQQREWEGREEMNPYDSWIENWENI